MIKVTVIDYGAGNILSVKRAFEYCGAEATVTDLPEDVLKAEILVLPGVGAFSDGMQGLGEKNLTGAILEYCKKGKPFLGICLGMQMMMDESEEFGKHKGLGLIPGKVAAIESTTVGGASHKIPHIGWNALKLPDGKDISWWENSVLSGIQENEQVYFVHSFTVFPEDEMFRLTDTYYGGRKISAAVRRDNLYGCQFHPEKSGQKGLKIIRNFLQLANY